MQTHSGCGNMVHLLSLVFPEAEYGGLGCVALKGTAQKPLPGSDYCTGISLHEPLRQLFLLKLL